MLRYPSQSKPAQLPLQSFHPPSDKLPDAPPDLSLYDPINHAPKNVGPYLNGESEGLALTGCDYPRLFNSSLSEQAPVRICRLFVE